MRFDTSQQTIVDDDDSGQSMQYSIENGQVTIEFDGKPADNVRQALKANGFRWSPKAGFWWRRRVTGAADVIGAIEKMITPKQPDGPCWSCKATEGYFRPRGAATPVYCDSCNSADLAHSPRY